MQKYNKLSVPMVLHGHPTLWFLNFAAMDVFLTCKWCGSFVN